MTRTQAISEFESIYGESAVAICGECGTVVTASAAENCPYCGCETMEEHENAIMLVDSFEDKGQEFVSIYLELEAEKVVTTMVDEIGKGGNEIGTGSFVLEDPVARHLSLDYLITKFSYGGQYGYAC